MFQFFGWLEDVRLIPHQKNLPNAFKYITSSTMTLISVNHRYYYHLFTWGAQNVSESTQGHPTQAEKLGQKPHHVISVRGLIPLLYNGGVAAKPGLAVGRGQLLSESFRKTRLRPQTYSDWLTFKYGNSIR